MVLFVSGLGCISAHILGGGATLHSSPGANKVRPLTLAPCYCCVPRWVASLGLQCCTMAEGLQRHAGRNHLPSHTECTQKATQSAQHAQHRPPPSPSLMSPIHTHLSVHAGVHTGPAGDVGAPWHLHPLRTTHKAFGRRRHHRRWNIPPRCPGLTHTVELRSRRESRVPPTRL